MSSDVAAVVVTYHSEAEIDSCLRSLQNVAEIVVVDNGSADRTCEIASRYGGGVRLIANRVNRGFAAAANQGVLATASPFVLFLNPDAVLLNSLRPLVEQMQTPGVGAVGGRLVDDQERTQVGFGIRAFPTPASLAFEALLVNRLWPRNPVNRRYRCLDLDHDRPQEVDQPAGAFLMVRREVLEAIGGWDERFYPLWFEDVDLCRRIRAAGWRIRYEPSAAARHRGAHSLARISLEDRQVYWYGSLLAYVGKYFPARARFLRACVAGGALVRMAGALGNGRRRLAYWRVLTLALGRPAAETRQVQPNVLT